MGTMQDREYRTMADVEADHWWYRGMRDLIGRVLVEHGYTERTGLRVLDAGCGTGENLAMLERMLPTAYLGGFDPSSLALQHAHKKAPSADVYLGDVCYPHFHSETYDLVLSCDVLCITGFAAARDGMRRIVERLEPDGLLIINLPAYQWLFSRHDTAVGTQRRFTAREVRRFLESVGLKVDLMTYRLFALLPAIVLARLPSILLPPRTGEPRSDLASPRLWTGGCLNRVLSWENSLILRGVGFPWGSSVFATARRNPYFDGATSKID